MRKRRVKRNKKARQAVQGLTLHRPREVRGVVLPLYFGYGLKLALVKIGNSYIRKIFGIRRWWQEAVALVLIVAVIVSSMLFLQAPRGLAATFHWIQTDWSGEASTTLFPAHPGDRTGWTRFYSKDPRIIAGPDLTLAPTPGFVTHTTDADFEAGIFVTTTVSGTGADAGVRLEIADMSLIKSIIDGAFDGARSVYATDLDGDGDQDVLGAAADADDIAWWRNDGGGTFTKSIIDGAFDVAISVHATDLDGDGDQDVLGAASVADDIAWWRNDPIFHFSGTFISSTLDIGGNLGFDSTLDFTITEPTGTDLKFQLRTADTEAGLVAAPWLGPDGTTGTFYETSGTEIDPVYDGHRWIQYKAYFSTTDTSVTPRLDDITINYLFFPALAWLISSPYDAGDAANVLADITWSESISAGVTDVKFQLRTSPDNATWTPWVGPCDGATGTFSTTTFFTDPDGGELIDADMKDGIDDQWIQYKVWLKTADGMVTPTLSDVTLTYVVNAPPEFNLDYPTDGAGGVLAFQGPDTKVHISYSIRDINTHYYGVARPGYVVPSFEYSLDGGASWATIPSTALAPGDLDNKAVHHTYWTRHTATWDAKTHLGSTIYTTTAQIRVTVDDGEAANPTASQASANFVLDTKIPSPSIIIDSRTDELTISMIEDSPVKMKISNKPDLRPDGRNADSGIWLPFGPDADNDGYGDPLVASTTRSWTLTGDIVEKVYFQFKDKFGNATNILSSFTPSRPSNVIFQDISHVPSGKWKIFIAWGAIPPPTHHEFKHYGIHRSTDGEPFSELKTIDDIGVNFIVDRNLTKGTKYHYKIYSRDVAGNVSGWSTIVSDTADGQGGTDLAPPSIFNIRVDDKTTQSATIKWNTNELSNSLVGFSEDWSFYSKTGVPTMTRNNKVVLTGLSPNTTYNFRVQSVDAAGNVSEWVIGGNFTTLPGPIISNVIVREVTDFSAQIIWETDIKANSFVIFSKNPDLSDALEFGTHDLTLNHSVVLLNLERNTRYFFFVRSTDGDENIAVDKNVTNGVITYYTFTTTKDILRPIITDVQAAVVDQTSATIIWTTNERATSQVEWGTTPAYGNLTTPCSDLKMSHSVTISELTPETTYHFRVRSVDGAGNETISDDQTFTTLAEGVRVVRRPPPPVDNVAPVISRIEITEITTTSAVIGWRTNELANSLVEYGLTPAFGQLAGQTEQLLISHQVTLENLIPDTLYHFQIVSLDAAGNRGVSPVQDFTTLAIEVIEVPEEVPEEIPEEVVEVPEEEVVEEITEEIIEEIIEIPEPRIAEIFKEASEKFLEVFEIHPHLTEEAFKAMVGETAERIVAPPLVVGEHPLVTVGPDWAEIRWVTDRPANSLVALAKAEDFDPARDEPYTDFISGPFGVYVTEHKIRINGLKPDTTYHFQVRSQAKIGPITKSPDQTFTTLSLLPEILEVGFVAIEEDKATLRWQTTMPTRTKIEIIEVATGKRIIHEDPSYLREHELIIPDLKPATDYTLQIISEDEQGNVSLSPIFPFTTTIWVDPPIISHVRVSTALIPGIVDRVQAIFSWRTDKPATSRVFYEEGIGVDPELAFSTPLDPDLVLDHVVITTALKPGRVYRFRVESIDALGNRAYSRDFTILTPRAEETVIDLIIENLEEAFGFLRHLRF
ncbi:fibronectin type III domain-containing protein [Dehalococcoidia bacterium]|nr:fibronectin type III domain-containing protein [Dehalococcoidia bacterium]